MSYLSLGDENDDNFSPSLGGMSSNLGSLFGMNAQMDKRAGSNQSLTYTAPKPPRPDHPKQENQEKKPTGSGGSGVAAAVAITAYKYVGNQYQSQGKLGMALLSNYSEKDFKVLMYVSKQQPVTAAKISAEFQFNIQSNNYASFHDDQRQAWSILFPAFEQLLNFAKQVCLAKYHSQTEYGVMTQDISLGESDSPSLALGDSVEAKYTGWLVSSDNGTIGNVFDSNHNSDKFFRFKTGKGKVIKGWEEGMIGMKKGGKRFLIIPPALAYGSKAVGNRVPPNSTLAFEVDIVRLKSSAPYAPTPNMQQNEQLDNIENSMQSGQSTTSLDVPQDTIKARASSINDQIGGGSSMPNAGPGKASLVSRMAKVGQPMLPMKPNTQPHEAHVKPTMQSEVEPMRQSPTVAPSHEAYHYSQADTRSNYSNSPGVIAQPNFTVTPNMEYQRVGYSPQPMQPVHLSMMQSGLPGNMGIQPTGIMGVNDFPRQAFQSSSFPQQFASPSVDILPAILVESQNSNYKLKSLMEKVDEVSEKVSKMKSGSNEYRPSSEIMDAAQISFNIQRILQENERVKKQILERDKLVQQQSDKIADLLQQNHKLIEESHEQITKRSVTYNERMGLSQEKTAKLEKENLEMSNKLSEATSKIYDLQLQLANASEKANSLEKIAKSSAGQIENEVRIRQLQSDLSSARESLASAQSEYKQLEVKSQESTAAALQQMNKRNETQHGFEVEITTLKEEMDSIKSRHGKELSSVQENYQTQLNDAVHRQQRLEDSWKEKCKNAVTKVSKAAEEKIQELEAEKEELSQKLEIFQKKMLQIRQLYQDKVNDEDQLKKQLAEVAIFKQKYDNLRQQALSMKQQYEDKISELQQASEGHGDGAPEARIKSVMNQVFQKVKAKIDREEEYSGSEILSIILSVIKSATLSLLTSKQSDDEEEDQVEDESDGDDDGNEHNDDNTKSVDGDSDQSAPSVTIASGKPEIARKPVLETQAKSSAGPVVEELTEHESETAENVETATHEEEEAIEESSTNECKEPVLETQKSETNETATDEDQKPVEEDQNASPSNESDLQEKVCEERPEIVVDKHEQLQKQDSAANAKDETANVAVADIADDGSLEDTKPTPPPLFDDDDDDDGDLDWLS